MSTPFRPDARALRGFRRIWLPLFVAALGAVLRWRFDLPEAALTVWSIGAVIAALAAASGAVARAVYVTLAVMTYPIAIIVAAVVLALLYLLVVTPIGVVMRLRGHDPLQLRARSSASQWRTYRQDDDPRRAVRQF